MRQGRIDPTSVRYYAPGGEVTDQPEPPPQQQAPGALTMFCGCWAGACCCGGGSG
ncbi:hypothetical protein JHV675_54240 [Mycobacterium avium subsp. hominissuis]